MIDNEVLLEKITEFIRKQKKTTPTEISTELKIAYYMVKFNLLNTLMERGIIEVDSSENGSRTYVRIKK